MTFLVCIPPNCQEGHFVLLIKTGLYLTSCNPGHIPPQQNIVHSTVPLILCWAFLSKKIRRMMPALIASLQSKQ